MLFIIICAILSGVGIFSLVVHNEGKFNRLFLLALIPLLLGILLQTFTIVPANSVGIKWSVFGGVSQETLSEGFQSKNPLDKVYLISTEVQTENLQQVTGQTRDSQYITMDIDVKYRVNPASAFEVFQQFRTLDSVAKSLIAPTVQRSIEAVSTSYNVIEILGEERNAMYKGIEVELADRLSVYGITFVSINFTDTDAGEAIEKAIQSEAVAKKAVETAQQELLRVEAEAQQIIVQAQAEQDAARILAETKVIHAQAEFEANTIAAESLTEAVLTKKIIDTWNGVLPLVVSDGSNILDIGSLAAASPEK